MAKTTLMLLAAGMGSRYGGLKQLDELGPNGETLLDYSVFDAMRAGFDDVVFIIRKDIEEPFKRVVGSRYDGKISVRYAFQRLDDLPGNFSVPGGRTKPWGTGQAVYAARDLVTNPFAVLNADDFYGRDGFRLLHEELAQDKGPGAWSMCGFYLANTLSDNGSVSRGVCQVGADGFLQSVVEHTQIFREGDGAYSLLEDGSRRAFDGREIVSMNMWGFRPDLFGELETLFVDFLREKGSAPKSEFYIPFVADAMIRQKRARVKVAISSDSWFGITYREDREKVVASLAELTRREVYPEKLF
ncbi:MAG: sugar phosphate nucleotidyltransferase [Victivallaceae bacterium]|nr:sugar phosphate nucleotidyltransferase [Victivallaceae bacterium]